jgi:hypothetical protein
VVNGAGHASTCGSRLDLTAVIRDGFPELQKTRAGVRWRKGKRTQQSNIEIDGGTDIASRESLLVKRTRMKPEAQQGYGPNYGMEERYDKADIGLNPLLYWSKSNYKSVRRVIQERHITVPKTQDRIHYRKSVYAVSD